MIRLIILVVVIALSFFISKTTVANSRKEKYLYITLVPLALAAFVSIILATQSSFSIYYFAVYFADSLLYAIVTFIIFALNMKIKEEIIEAKPEEIIANLNRINKQSTNTSAQNITEMAANIIGKARINSFLSPGDQFPHIPELLVESKNVCTKVALELVKIQDGNNPRGWFTWGALAGIGAVYHWDKDWNGLKAKGIAETLLEPKGVANMDDYVFDCIGIGLDTEGSKVFQKQLAKLIDWTKNRYLQYDDSNMIDVAFNIMQAMYIFGMVWEMDKLGMR